jgi:peptidoglycan/LPS O-acetylase OafA/YrhL
MNDSNSTTPNRILELDGLRAFAVLSVVVAHMCGFSGALPRGPEWLANIIAYLGPGGVNIFFVISGYIITTLLMRENAATTKPSLAGFYIRRFFRIVPPFALYLLTLLILQRLGVIRLPLEYLVWSGLFLGDTTLIGADSFVSHTWSLAVEEQFYLVFPPLLVIVLGFRKQRILPTLSALYVLCLVSRKLAYELSTHVAPYWTNLSALYHFRYIIVGVLLATHGEFVLSLIKNRSRIWPIGLAIASFIMRMSNVRSVLGVAFAAIEPIVCGLFVMWFMQNPDHCSFLRRPVVQWLGTCSYSIYLWQQLFTSSPSLQNGDIPQSAPLAAIGILTCAAISYYLVECPCIRFGRAIARRVSHAQVERG